MTEAIVYTSKHGSTEAYAGMLSDRTGIPAYTLKEALRKLPSGSRIIYMGCVRADNVLDLDKAEKAFNVAAVCAVGMSKTGENTDRIRKASRISESKAVFTLQGNYHPESLKGIDRLIMKMMSKVLIKQINEKESPSEEDRMMVKLLTEGGDMVAEENLAAVLDWIKK